MRTWTLAATLSLVAASCGPGGASDAAGTDGAAVTGVGSGMTASTGPEESPGPCKVSAPQSDPNDPDDDGPWSGEDNCPGVPNDDQKDGDGDGIGDVCDCGDAPCDCGIGAPNADGDLFPDACDNCPGVPSFESFGQSDIDNDGVGDLCDCGDKPCHCGIGAPDVDGDCYPDACDNCPMVANAWPPQDRIYTGGHLSDIDEDGFGNACDECPRTAAVVSGNCCDPRVPQVNMEVCSSDPGGNIDYYCQPGDDGVLFACVIFTCTSNDINFYGKDAFCIEAPTAPPGALKPLQPSEDFDCDHHECVSKWCEIGDDAACGAGNVCLPWHLPAEAPPGLADLGACARNDKGPCVDKVGRQCLAWRSDQLP